MESKKSKVTRVLHNTNQYNGTNGTVFYHEVTFENGDKGKYGSKEDTCKKFVEGQLAEYTIETKQNGNYTNIIIKPVQTQQTNSNGTFKNQPKNEEMIVAQSTLGYACTFYAQRGQVNEDMVIAFANKMFNEVMKYKK